MYTSVCVSQFFSKFQEQFSAYNFVGAVYSPEMDFSKLKPLILNTQNTSNRNKAWCGIIFTRSTATTGDVFYRSFEMREEYTPSIEVKKVPKFKCAQSSCELSFNIVSNELLHLEALENELRWNYNGRYQYKITLNKLPEYLLDIGQITYGDFTKYNSIEYGQLCSLGMSVILNYPILLRSSDINVIHQINYILGANIPDNVFYETEIKAK